MRNPYFIDEPAAVSFSGGRSSGMMVYKVLEAHGFKLPDHIKYIFTNTGKEHESSLRFVDRFSKQYDVPIVWIELSKMENIGSIEKPKYNKEYKIVTFETASRNGEPFQILLDAMPAIPNMVNMACTAYLKTRLMRAYCDDIGMSRGCLTLIGMRADENKRISSTHNKKIEGFLGYCPLYVDGVKKLDVKDFWDSMPFDLELPNNRGVTDMGNCVLCYKKALGKRESIIRSDPSLADFWIKAEKDKNQFFRLDQPSYSQMKEYALSQNVLFDEYSDESIPCFCGD